MNRLQFIDFLNELKTEYINHPDNWKNKNIDDYLDAMISYTEDIQGFYDNTSQKVDANKPDWKVFADILKGASIYE